MKQESLKVKVDDYYDKLHKKFDIITPESDSANDFTLGKEGNLRLILFPEIYIIV